MLEIDGDAGAGDGLHLAQAPAGLSGVAHELAGLQDRKEFRQGRKLPLRFFGQDGVPVGEDVDDARGGNRPHFGGVG